jgi:hypothetical protein
MSSGEEEEEGPMMRSRLEALKTSTVEVTIREGSRRVRFLLLTVRRRGQSSWERHKRGKRTHRNPCNSSLDRPLLLALGCGAVNVVYIECDLR